jgi:hypothetical protein
MLASTTTYYVYDTLIIRFAIVFRLDHLSPPAKLGATAQIAVPSRMHSHMGSLVLVE